MRNLFGFKFVVGRLSGSIVPFVYCNLEFGLKLMELIGFSLKLVNGCNLQFSFHKSVLIARV